MVYFISDMHLGHKNIIDLCNRPFSDVEEMDRVLIDNWNRKVKKNDTVYIIGDFIWDKKKVGYYTEQLSGKKILIVGNHDLSWSRREECQGYFDLITQYFEVSLNNHPITMCHYPMLEWRSSRETVKRRLGYHIHGHIHNRVSEDYRMLYIQFNALNAGVDINNFTPVSFDELAENNLKFKLSALQSQADKDFLLSELERE